MITALLLSFVAALLAPAVHRVAKGATGMVLALVPLGLFVYFFSYASGVYGGTPVREVTPWVPSFNILLSFYIDGFGLLFAQLISGLGTLIVLYAGTYLKGDPQKGRFLMFLLLFMSSMLGLVLADNIIALFIFWELTSITSYLLIGYKHKYEESRSAALQALLVTGGGGLAMLAGLLMLANAGGSMELSEIRALGAGALTTHLHYLPILALVLAGCFTKSAQFPFHFWLPNAMAAPTPVSAFLHSATMVKAGVYLMARLHSTLGGTPEWVWTLSIFGSVTMIVGAVLALRQTDLKKILAYSTVTALGTLTLLLGLPHEKALVAAMTFLVVHSLYKGALFLSAGTVDHETGTRDVLRLGGLRPVMPITFVGVILAVLSMAGLPPLFGFVAKELVYETAVNLPSGANVVVAVVALVANALTVVAGLVVLLRPFFGPKVETPHHAHEAPWTMWIGPLLLGVVALVLGTMPYALATPFMSTVVLSLAAEPFTVKLSLWHGFNLALGMSVVTLILGVLGYRYWDGIRTFLSRFDGFLATWGAEKNYNRTVYGMLDLAGWQTRMLGTGGLSGYMLWVLAALVGAPGLVLLLSGPITFASPDVSEVLPHEWVLVVLASIAAVVATLTKERLLQIGLLGTVGFSVATLFVGLGAPDLAITQFIVESLVVIIILLVVRFLPDDPGPKIQPSWRAVSLTVAVLGGIVTTVLVLGITALPLDTTVSDYHLAASVPLANGHNVVNVILVDFRGLDTMGEITVLAIAALGAYVLVRVGQTGPVPMLTQQGPMILRTASRLLLVLLLLTSLFVLWRGHNEPGGGFIGGLVAAAAFALYGMAYGARNLEELIRVRARTLLGIGLAFGVTGGLMSVLKDGPFFQGVWLKIPLESGEVFKIGSPFVFDLGVYLVVIGFTLTFILALERATPPSTDSTR